MERTSNYGSEKAAAYDSTVADLFIRLRGHGLMLSPLDAGLIQQWREWEIPQRVVLAAIEKVMGNQHGRRIRSISYCQEEVEAQFAEWLEMRVGSSE